MDLKKTMCNTALKNRLTIFYKFLYYFIDFYIFSLYIQPYKIYT